MKGLYVCSKELLLASARHITEFHYLDLPDGQVIAKCEFRDSHHEGLLSGQPGVHGLNHVCKAETMDMHPEFHSAIAHLGVQPTDTTHATVKKLRSLHPLLGI